MDDGDEGNWQDVLRAQQEELRRLELMNDELDAGTNQLDADINKALKKTSTKIATARPLSARKRGASGGAIGVGSPLRGRDLVAGLEEDVPGIPDIDVGETAHKLPDPAPPSPDIDPKAPETAAK